MKKLKQALSLTLALVLSLALAAPAFAAPVTVGDEFNYARTTFSDVVSQETVKGSVYSFDGDPNAIPLITVKVGTTITIDNNGMHRYTSGREFRTAEIKEDGSYKCSFEGKSFNTGVADGTPFTLTDEHIGLWFFSGGDEGKNYYLNIIAGDGSAAAPAQPAEPAEPAAPAEPAQPAEPAKPAQPAVTIPEGSVAYTVQKGDTLGFIATNFYGNNAQREALYQANIEAFRATKGALKPGMVLAIPAVLNKAVRIAAPAAGEGEKLYTVKAGDTLGQIAAAEYGNANAYKAIFERNSDRLKDANTIYEGQVIVLPAKK